MIKLGSVFSGIGGFELGLERALPQCKTIWQVEEDTFCQSILRKHWADAIIYDDIRTVGAHNLESVDVLCGGFPCQDLSISGKMRGINHGKKSNLYYEMFRVICELRPRIVVFENVSNITTLGGHDVCRTLASAGYDAEWCTIRTGADFGLPHIRRRWFCVAYTNGIDKLRTQGLGMLASSQDMQSHSRSQSRTNGGCNTRTGNRSKSSPPPAVCRMDDGIPAGMDRAKHNRIRKQRLKALGNAITPQASEWIGKQILHSGLLDDLIQ